MKDRRRAARFQFSDRNPVVHLVPELDEAGSGMSVSDDIFGRTPAEIVPPAMARPTTGKDVAVAPALPGPREFPAPDDPGDTVPASTLPVPATLTALVVTPATAVFVPADEDIDLNAVAAKFGVNTHKE